MEGVGLAVSFGVELDHAAPGVVVVRVHGDIDFVTAPGLRATIAEQLTAHPRQLIIDLDGVAFLDTAALAVLVEAHTARGDLRVVCSNPRPLRALEISGLANWLPVVSSLTAALGEHRAEDRLEPA